MDDRCDVCNRGPLTSPGTRPYVLGEVAMQGFEHRLCSACASKLAPLAGEIARLMVRADIRRVAGETPV